MPFSIALHNPGFVYFFFIHPSSTSVHKSFGGIIQFFFLSAKVFG